MLGALAPLIALVYAACSSPMPEAGSPSAELYVRRCGTCHVPYRPALLTAKMWDAMIQRMEIEMARRGVALTEADKTEIVAYLHRNAGDRAPNP